MANGVKLMVSGVAAVLAVAALWWLSGDAPEAAPPTPTGNPAPAPVAATREPPRAAADTPAAADPGDRVAVPVAATWVVRGRAVRKANVPAPGARVLARVFTGTAVQGEPALEAHLVADADGHFAWPLEPSRQIVTCDLRGEGERIRAYAETFVVAPDEPPPDPFDLYVVPLDAIARGVVLDDQGRPLADVRVGPDWRGGVVTDAAGRFTVAVERTATVRLHASARGFVQLRQEIQIDVARGEGEAELRLRKANRIHGRVTDTSGQPVAGATVRTFYTIYADAAATDVDGRYVLDNLDPSLQQHSVFARKAGFVEANAEVEATSPDVERNLVLAPGVGIRGSVWSPAGRPVAAAKVFLGSSPNAYDRLDAVTDLDGNFSFDCVAAGEHVVNVERRGFAGSRTQVTVPKAPSAPVVVRVDLQVGHFVAGIATGPDGRPLVGVSIAPKLQQQYLEGIRSKTDAQGRFRLEGLPGEGLSLEFYGGGVVRRQVPVAAVDRADLAVSLERHGFMAGKVIDGRTRQPIRDFRIRFGTPRLLAGDEPSGGYSAQWLRGGKAFHDAQGIFRIDEEVRIGSVFALEASAVGYGPLVLDRVVVQQDPDPEALLFALFPGATIPGVVLDRSTRQPVSGAKVKAWASGRPLQPQEPNDDEGRPIATTDLSGAFSLDNVGPGEVTLAVEHPDWLPAAHGPITVVAGAAMPAQEVLLDQGATVTVDVRLADGQTLADAELVVVSRGLQRTARTDAGGTARFERLPPGKHELVLTEPYGAQRIWTFRRPLLVTHEDQRFAFVASDGDATLVVVLESAEALPDGLQLWCSPSKSQPGAGATFTVRGAAVQPERTVIRQLPAMELRVSVLPMGANLQGTATVTTRAGETVEVRIPVQPAQPRGGR